MALDVQSAESRKGARAFRNTRKSLLERDVQVPRICCPICCFPLQPVALSFLPGGNCYMKGAGMLVVSLRGVNFRFWSHLGCSVQNTIIFSRNGLF